MAERDPSVQPKVELQQAKKVALAFSGGLDSTLAIKLLFDYYSAEQVLPVTVNVGLTDQEIEDCRSKAELTSSRTTGSPARFAPTPTTRAIRSRPR